MPSAYTQDANIIQPQVLGDVVATWLYYNSALIGSGAATELTGAMWNAGGSTVTFRKLAGFTAGSATLPTDGTQVDSKNVTMTSYTKTVTNKIVSIAMSNVALEDVTQDVDLYNAVVDQVGSQVRDDVDAALITEACTSTLSHDCTGASISYNDIVTAKMKWADKSVIKNPVLVCHSAVYNDLLKLSQVATFNNWGAGPAVQSGAVPYIAGMPVIVSDNVTNADGVYTNLIVDRGALQYAFKRLVTVEVKNQPGNDMHWFDFTYRYVVNMTQSNPLPVVKYITGLA